MTLAKHFSSPKVHGFISYTEELFADALIQATLEPNVQAMKFVSEFERPGETRMQNLILVRRLEGLFELRIKHAGEAIPMRAPLCCNSKLRVWTLEEVDILAFPRLENARTIYMCRDVRISVHLRMLALETVRSGPVELGFLTERLASFPDAYRTIFHLAWIGALRLAANGQRIGPSTLVSASKT
ncbi:hypothetical protein [Bradyrhizobium lablabi]|uniref:hypothetical protein n=1 Tax=Bradyrhizobium lablabi TaxID=722472 RepID=UPI001BAB7007|nr:hypothetical protein [Bradyrhizobium lablabi]MBR0695334.1 hypothetical protein [Bradyrhizobium lablabi]